uniref:Uncharacterized protein n=1 Tax=Candidatus Kentrum sp. FW TaxID=2126338 RepID=A0A450U4N2_9GAMM|nr:MAG: hypothetical protein BECKFW1821C_GA0114237_12191 [Candidatus Kentron sp. FW]
MWNSGIFLSHDRNSILSDSSGLSPVVVEFKHMPFHPGAGLFPPKEKGKT